ncbi:MAG TPA: carboxylesterase family protein [Pseudonocardia sp.]|nr:carboxylesterase family protein [Pseudonocardia sp.]
MIVHTNTGAVRGLAVGAVTAFLGIPYAAPLEAHRRFAAPEPPTAWEGVRPATTFSAVPAQTSRPAPIGPPLWGPTDDPDCLSVNVWTPDPGSAGLPVLVWIYGGAFLHGSSSEALYDGTRLAERGAVVVSFNYRVGFEGMGWLPDAPSNRFLLDQLAALRWVRDNIAGFGGDPDKVTVFGQSAGATSVLAVLCSPASRGLLRRAIAQSPPGRYRTPDQARRMTETVAREVGAPATAAAFAQVPATDLHRASATLLDGTIGGADGLTDSVSPYAPIIDGELVTAPSWRALRDGAGRDNDLLIGFARDEFRLFNARPDLPAADPAETARALSLGPDVLAAYREARPGASETDLHLELMSDARYRMNAVYCARAHAAAGGATYLYEFTWPSPSLGGALGACHGIDLPFVFGATTGPMVELMLGDALRDDVESLSRALQRAWVSFAATGEPGWPRYRAVDQITRVWDLPPTLSSDPQALSRQLWSTHFE